MHVCVYMCVTLGCLFANRVLQSQICVTGGPAGLQCVLSTSALLGEKLSHPLTQGNNSSVLLPLNTTTFYLPKNTSLLQFCHFEFTIQPSNFSQQHVSRCGVAYCAQMCPTKYQYSVKFTGVSAIGEYKNWLQKKKITDRDGCLHAGVWRIFSPQIHIHRATYNTLHAYLIWRKLCKDLSLLWSIVQKLSKQSKILFCASYLAVEPCGEENVIFVLHQLLYMSPQGNIRPMHAFETLTVGYQLCSLKSGIKRKIRPSLQLLHPNIV